MDLEKTIQILRKYNIKLNPSKCTFRMALKKFLDFVVTYREIKANQEKTQAILEMLPSRIRREVQCLTGCMITLSRFMVRSVKKFLPFFNALK